MPNTQNSDLCAEPFPANPTVTVASAEWAHLTYLAATSYLFAQDYPAAIAQYDQIRQLYPPLTMAALNNRGVASMNLAAHNWNNADTSLVIQAEQAAQCAFARVIRQGEGQAGADAALAHTRYLAHANWGMAALYAKLILMSAVGLTEPVIAETEGIQHCEAAQQSGNLGDLCKAAHLLDEAWLKGAAPRAKNLLLGEELLGGYAKAPNADRVSMYPYWRGYLAWIKSLDETDAARKTKVAAEATVNFKEFICPEQPLLRLATDRLLVELGPPVKAQACPVD